jgi:hypothetical protein
VRFPFFCLRGGTDDDPVENWQVIKLETMLFPAEMLVDYVRVYQRDGETNIGCNPSDFPTTDYINAHYEAYASEFVSCFCSARASPPRRFASCFLVLLGSFLDCLLLCAGSLHRSACASFFSSLLCLPSLASPRDRTC